MPRLIFAPCLALLLVLSGCGGSSEDSVRSSISNMQSVIQAYNNTRPSDLAGTAAACRTAFDDLNKNKDIVTTRLTGSHAPEQRALRAAYRSARSGFLGCASGAASLNYPAIVAAQQDIAAANTAIARARRMEP